MRVISGSQKGIKLKFPKSKNTRPMTDRAKEGLFSVIIFEIEGANVLDLYAGSGSLGIEALSRGAQNATFVDYDKESIKTIQENLRNTGFLSKSNIIRGKVEDFLAHSTSSGQANDDCFDIIFFAPPWKELNFEVLKRANKLLVKNGILVLESFKKTEIPERFDSFSLIKQKLYGDTKISFFKAC